MEKYKVIALYAYGLRLDREIDSIVQSQPNCILPNRIECYLLTRDQFIRATSTNTISEPVYQYTGMMLNRIASFKTVIEGKPERTDILLREPINNRRNIAYIVFRGCSDGTSLEELPASVPVEAEEEEKKEKAEEVAEVERAEERAEEKVGEEVAYLSEREQVEIEAPPRRPPATRVERAERIASAVEKLDTVESLSEVTDKEAEEITEKEEKTQVEEVAEEDGTPLSELADEDIQDQFSKEFVPEKASVSMDDIASEEAESDVVGEIEYEMDEFIQIPEYECEYDETELVESLAQELHSMDEKITLTDALRTSQFIQDMVRKTRQYDGEGHPVRGFASDTRDADVNPMIDRFESGHYDTMRIYPIVTDYKKIYLYPNDNVAKDEFLFHEFEDIQKAHRQIKELYRRYARSSYNLSGKMNYTEFTYHMLKGGMVEIDGEEQSIDPQLLPYKTPIDIQMESISHFRATLPNSTLVFRQQTIPNLYPDVPYPANIPEMMESTYRKFLGNAKYNKGRKIPKKPEDKELPLINASDSGFKSVQHVQCRYTTPIITQLKDTYADNYYTDTVGGVKNIKTCVGAGKVKDMFYADDDKKSDFFRSIHHAPFNYNASNLEKRELPSYKGEEVCITGFFIPSIHHRRIITAPSEESAVIETRDGKGASASDKYRKVFPAYTPAEMPVSSKELQRSVYPHQYDSNTRRHENLEKTFAIKTNVNKKDSYVVVDYRNFDWKNVDDEKDYYVFFDPTNYLGEDNAYTTYSMTHDDYHRALEKVLPSVSSVLEREEKHIQKCKNLCDLQVVLRPYHINVRDITDAQFKKSRIAECFRDIIASIKMNAELHTRKTRMLRSELQKVSTILHQVQQHRWLRQRAIKGTQLTQYDFTDDSLRTIIQEETAMILSGKPLLTLLILYRFLTGVEPVESDFSYENKTSLVKKLVQHFDEHSISANQASEFYKVFSQFSANEASDDPMYGNIEKLFQLYMELFQVSQIASFDRAMYGSHDANQLKEIQMMWNLNAHNSGGRELLQIFHLVQLLKYKRYVHQSFESYGKTEYELETGNVNMGLDMGNSDDPILSWTQLPEKRKELYYPSEKLLKQLHTERQDIYDIYESERKKYSEYITRCGSIRIAKVYSQLDRLYRDNGIDIFFDESYDTTSKDVTLYQSFVKESTQPSPAKFKNKLRDLYLFDSDTEINKKWENVERVVRATSKDLAVKKRMVADGDICMLVTEGQVSYYQRTQKHWIRMERDLIENHHIEMSMDWLKMSFQELSDTMESNECVTVPMEHNQIPVEMRNIYTRFIMISRKEEMVKTMVQFHRQVSSDIQQLFQYLNERYYGLLFDAQFKNKTYVPSSVYKRAIEFTKENTNIASDIEDATTTAPQSKRVPLVKPPASVVEQFNAIRRISDSDVQYQQLNEFIRKYGIDHNASITTEFIEQYSITDDTFPTNSPFHPDQANPSTATYHFYNIHGVNVPLICRHHDAFRKHVFADNETKERILMEVKDKWGSGTSFFSEQILCRNCGEVIDVRRFSGAEGFGRDERAIQVRERVVDYEDMEELEKVESGITKEIQQESLKGVDDISNMINSVSQIIRSILYVTQIHMTTEDYIAILRLTFRNIDNEVYTAKTEEKWAVVSQLKAFKSLGAELLKQLKISNGAVFFLERAIAAFIHVLRVSTPEYMMKGSGFERKTAKFDKTTIFNDFYHNESELVPFFSKKIIKYLEESKGVTALKNILLLINLFYKTKESPDVTTGLNQHIQEQYTNIASLSYIQVRYTEKEEFLKRQEAENQFRLQYGYWPTFLPSLQYNDTAAVVSDNPSSMYMNKVYQYIRTQPQRNVRSAAYVAQIDEYSVLSNYARDIQEKVGELAELYGQLQVAYDKQMAEMTNPFNTVEFIIPKLMGRDLQDYMYTVEALMLGQPESKRSAIERKNMEQKWMQLNLQVFLTEDAQGNRVGIPRVYREIMDDDFYLLGEIYAELYDPAQEEMKVDDTEIALRLESLLREKYSTMKTIEKTDDWFKFKVAVILHMNTEPNPDQVKSDPTSPSMKLTCTYDIISGKFKTEINNEVNARMKSLSMDELQTLLLKNERFSLTVSEKNMLDDRVRLPTAIELESAFIESQLYNWMRLLLPSDVLSQEIIESINKIKAERAELMNMDATTLDKYNTEFLQQPYLAMVGGGRSSYYVKSIVEMYKKYVSNTPAKVTAFESMMKQLGSMMPVYRDLENQLPETLTIEGFVEEEQRQTELTFRRNRYENMQHSNQLHVLYNMWQVIRNAIIPHLTEKELFYIRTPLPTEKELKNDKKGVLLALREHIIGYLSEYNQKYGGSHFSPEAKEHVRRWAQLDAFVEQMISLETTFDTTHRISRLSVFHPMWMCIILRYMCYSMMMEIATVPENVRAQVFQTVSRQLDDTMTIENSITSESNNVIKKLRADENKTRKQKFDKMSDEMKSIRKVSRAFNLGNMIGKLDEGLLMSAEELFMAEGAADAEADIAAQQARDRERDDAYDIDEPEED